jgi:EmrB/QacA subfamily drug resistance transporter
MNDTGTGGSALSELRSGRQSSDRIVLILACVAQFMVVLDVSVVNVALPSIGRDLHYSATGLQWVVNAYVLTFAGFLLLGGRAADLFGRRRLYMAGLILFTSASLVGGFAQNAAWLTTARVVQGIGGALLSPATLTIIVTTFSGARLARALGVWSAVAGAGGAAGSILGGVLTAEASWRWVLFINVPIGVVVLIFALRYLTELRRGERTARLDVAGAITVTAGLGVLIYAIVGTDTHPWGSAQTLSTLGAAVVLLGTFAVIERRVASAPLVPFGLFRSRSLSGANLVMLLIGAGFFSMWYFLSLYMQNVLGYGALRTGVAFLPMAISVIIGAQISSRVLPRLGSKPLLIAGTLIVGVGFAWLSRIPAVADYWGHVFGPGCLISLSLGLLFTPLAAAGTAGVSQSEAGLASGVLNTSRQVGGSMGLAALATVATDHTIGLLHGRRSAAVALTSGYARAFEVAAVLGLAAFLLTLIVPNIGRSPVGFVARSTDTPRADDADAKVAVREVGATGTLETEPA